MHKTKKTKETVTINLTKAEIAYNSSGSDLCSRQWAP